MLEHSQINNLQKSINDSMEMNKKKAEPKQLLDLSGSFDESINLSGNKAAVGLADIEKDIAAILKDNRKMANFQRVISCAALYSQAVTEEDKLNNLFAIRESAANYLIQRKSSSSAARKKLCEKIIRSIDAYARQNNLSATHDVNCLLDGRHITYDEIDNEINLAHSLVSDKPLGKITDERRESFKRKLVDVKDARTLTTDITKWKNKNAEFLQGKIAELELAEGVNEYYDNVLVDTISWYGKANNLQDEAMTTMLTRLKTDDDKDHLQISIKARQIETILSDILSWNMEDFTFNKTEDFLHRKDKGETERDHFLKLYSKLQVAKNADRLLAELLRIQENLDAPQDFSKKTIEELKLRLKIYKQIELDYSERLDLMNSPYYVLLQQPDIEKALTSASDKDLVAYKKGKKIPGMKGTKQVPPEFSDYIDKLLLKRKLMKETKVSDYFTRHTALETAIKQNLKSNGVDFEERKRRLAIEARQLRGAYVGDLNRFKKEQLQDQRQEEKKNGPEDDVFKEWVNIDSSMRNIQGKSFVPVQKPDTKAGLWGKLKNYGMVGARWMFGASFGVVGTIVGAAIAFPKQLGEKEKVANSQKKRTHGIVPGTKDERFDDEDVKDTDEEDRILFDVRRAPLIWEKLSAGDPESPPEVTVMVDQSRDGVRETNIEGMGHVMIGLSYSRFNKATGRKERYQLKMGFYPGGGANAPDLQLMMTSGAMVHGQIRNDEGHAFTVSRKYQVKPGDINRIIKATENYADGGYGFYKRNCSTYVMDMAKLANLPVAGEAEIEDIHFTGLKSHAANVLAGGAYTTYQMAANNMADKLQKNDLTYQHFGQKMITKEDLDRYYNTAKNGDVIKKGYSPGALGEVLSDSKNGEMSAYSRAAKKTEEGEFGDFHDKFINEGTELTKAIKNRIESQGLKLTQEDRELMMTINTDLKLESVIGETGKGIADEARDRHKQICERMKRLNEYYKGRLKSDYALNAKVMNYLSLCEVALGFLDKTYNSNIRYEYKGDAGCIYSSYEETFELIYKNGDGDDISIDISPQMYHGYLKMGYKPGQIIKELNEYVTLRMTENLTDEQYKRLNYLQKIYDMAGDFGTAAMYTMTKEEFTQKDINYAFSELPKQETVKEKGEKFGGDFSTYNLPSLLNQAAIMEKVLGGMNIPDITGIADDNQLTQSLDTYIHDKMEAKKDFMKNILFAYISGKDQEEADVIAMNFVLTTLRTYVYSIFRAAGADNNRLTVITMNLLSMQGTMTWLTDQIRALRNNGGAA